MFTFRRLTRDDFDLLARWLAEPHVHEWWDHEFTPEALDSEFGPTADGDEPAEDYVALLDGEPVGLVQGGVGAAVAQHRHDLRERPPRRMSVGGLAAAGA